MKREQICQNDFACGSGHQKVVFAAVAKFDHGRPRAGLGRSCMLAHRFSTDSELNRSLCNLIYLPAVERFPQARPALVQARLLELPTPPWHLVPILV